MRVVVDDGRCQGHTLCHMVAGQIFKLRDDDGHAYVDDENVPEALEDLALKAQAGCPEQAITVILEA